mgnify:CR=1 FL=1
MIRYDLLMVSMLSYKVAAVFLQIISHHYQVVGKIHAKATKSKAKTNNN